MATATMRALLRSLVSTVDKLEAGRRDKGRTRLLKGLEFDAVCDAVEAAIDPADEDLLESILTHCDAAAERPLHDPPLSPNHDYFYPGCNEERDVHFFLYWLWGLEIGSWALPDPMPRAVLEGFNAPCGCVLWRCEDCLTGLGNGSRHSACPVCGSDNLSHKKLSGPTGHRHYEYTPLPTHGRRRDRST
jgi:hypothetical protein